MPSLQKHVRNTFLAGLFAATPLAVTGFVLWYVNGKTSELLHIRTPFVALLITLAAIYLLGLIVTSIVGRFILGRVDRMLSRLPVVRDIYQAWKHVSLTPGGREGIYGRTVLVRDTGGSQFTLGFCSGVTVEGSEDLLCVFVPMAPNPVTGRIIFAPRAACNLLDLPVEEAFKIILSSGNYVPRELGAAVRVGV